MASPLAGGANRTVLLITSCDTENEPNSYYHAALEIGALRVCAQTGFELVTHSVVQTGADVEARIRHLVEESRCSGAILTPPFSDWPRLVKTLAVDGRAVPQPATGVAPPAPDDSAAQGGAGVVRAGGDSADAGGDR